MNKQYMAFPYFPEEDIEEILSRFRSILAGDEMLTMGKNVNEFEREFAGNAGTKYAVVTNSCTSALELVLRSFGIGNDDEVIVPVQTFIATGSCIAMTGARVVFSETNDDFLLDFNDLKKRITDKTKAVIIVHFAGLVHPQINEIKNFLQKKNIVLIEDAAHAHGAELNGKKAGSFGDAACFSFFSTKIMTTGEGGMITTSDERINKACSSMRNRGIDTTGKQEIFNSIGSNRRMTEFQAILGRYQLKRLSEFNDKRNRIAAIYKEILSSLEKKGVLSFQDVPEFGKHAYWRFSVFINDERTDLKGLQKRMSEKGIPIDFPYTPLLHLQPVFRHMYGTKEGMFPLTEKRAAKHFCLPMHVLIKEAEAAEIADILKKEIE